MQLIPSGTSEVAIFSRVLQPNYATLPVAAARAILTLGFTQADKERMRELAAKARADTLTPDEDDETTNYERVGHVLSLWKLKARRSLNSRSSTNGNAGGSDVHDDSKLSPKKRHEASKPVAIKFLNRRHDCPDTQGGGDESSQ